MLHTSRRSARNAGSVRQNPVLTRICIGVLGLLPVVTAALMTLVSSLPIAAVVAGLGAVTFMSLLPRGEGRRP